MGTKQTTKEIEVDDAMVVAAATDINTVLSPKPLLDLEKAGEELQKEIEELFPNIVKGDALSKETWATLIALGWRAVEAPKIEKPKSSKPVKATKEPKAVKEPKAAKEPAPQSDVLPGFPCRKGSATEWFITALKKKPATMGTIRKLAGNPGGTYYSVWKLILAAGKGKIVDGLMTIKSK
jgi:hypothetical protein